MSKKGGVGKSTLVCALGLYLAERAGKRVAILDREVGGGSSAFVRFAGHDRLTEYERGQVYDFEIIDSPGNVSDKDLANLEITSDLVIIPLEITPLDIAKTYTTIGKLQQPEKARLLINKVRTNTTAWRERDDNLSGLEISVLRTAIHRRTCYTKFLVNGWQELNREAISELERLAWEVST